MKRILRLRRARRTRARLTVSSHRPRLTVFRSKKYITGQIIARDGRVLVALSDSNLDGPSSKGVARQGSAQRGVARAFAAGKLLAARAKEKKIAAVAFDKGSYLYHGRVKAFADGVREGGIEI